MNNIEDGEIERDPGQVEQGAGPPPIRKLRIVGKILQRIMIAGVGTEMQRQPQRRVEQRRAPGDGRR